MAPCRPALGDDKALAPAVEQEEAVEAGCAVGDDKSAVESDVASELTEESAVAAEPHSNAASPTNTGHVPPDIFEGKEAGPLNVDSFEPEACDEPEAWEPCIYLTVEDMIFVKPSYDPASAKIMKHRRTAGTRIYTTGQTWTGSQGGLWVEFDDSRMDDFGWTLVQGPGFGVKGPVLVKENDSLVVQVRGSVNLRKVSETIVLEKSASVGHLIEQLAARTRLESKRIRLTKGVPRAVPNERAPLGHDFTKRSNVLVKTCSIGDTGICGPVNLVYLGDCQAFDRFEEPAVQTDTQGGSIEEASESENESLETAHSTGDNCHFEVLRHGIAVRQAPSTSAPCIGTLFHQKIVYGTPYKFGGKPWLRLDSLACKEAYADADCGWALIHGSCLGRGQLLRKLSEAEEQEQIKKKEEMAAAAAQKALEDERAALAAAREEADRQRRVLQEEMAALEARRAAEVEAQKGPETGIPLTDMDKPAKAKEKPPSGDGSAAVQGASPEKSTSVAAVQDALEVERAALEAARKAAEEQRKAFEAEKAELEAKKAAMKAESEKAALEAARQASEEQRRALEAERAELEAAKSAAEAAKAAAAIVGGKQPAAETGNTEEAAAKAEGTEAGQESKGGDEGKGVAAVSSPPKLAGPAEAWTVDDVVRFLEEIDLGHVTTEFRNNGVDGEMLVSLSEEDLINELGVSKLQARKVQKRLKAFA